MADKRIALLIGNATFNNKEHFPLLSTPENDVRDVAKALAEFGDFHIHDELIDENHDKIRLAV